MKNEHEINLYFKKVYFHGGATFFCIDWLLSTCLDIRLRVEQCDEGGGDGGRRHHLAVGVVGAEVPVPGEKSHQMPLYASIKSCTTVIIVQL